MTLLLGTKTSSTPVGDASGGDNKAARSLLSCSSWRGMGRLWRGMGGMGRPEPLSAHRPHRQQGHSGFHETRNTAFLVLKPFSLFWVGGRFRLRVMTPLLGTKTSSTPVGDASGGDNKAARSLLSCSSWRGMGRLWRGMGGMGRPEPLSAHRPRRQQGHSGFHETRNTAFLVF